jgi:hypothetical protein
MRLVGSNVAVGFAVFASAVAACQSGTNPPGTDDGAAGSGSGVLANDASSDQSSETASSGSSSGAVSKSDSGGESGSTMNTCPSSCANDSDCLKCSTAVVFCCYQIAAPNFCYQAPTGSCATSSMTDGGQAGVDAAPGG